MGNLTDDMTRLRGEVDALRSARGALMQDLMRGARDLTATVAAMRADFASAHAAMARQTRGRREAFVAVVIGEVNSLLSTFSRDRNDMAREGRHDRGVFLAEIRRQVTDRCKNTADDLMGVRLVWRGRNPGESSPVPLKKEPVVGKAMSPPVEAALKRTVEATEIMAERPLITREDPMKEAEGRAVPAPDSPAVAPPMVEPPSFAGAPMLSERGKEKAWLDEKPAKMTTKAKRGKK